MKWNQPISNCEFCLLSWIQLIYWYSNCWQEPIKDANAAAKAISALQGVVDHGFFMNMASVVIIAGSNGITVQTKDTV